MVNWKELLRRPAARLGLDVDKESDLVSLAQYIYNDSKTKTPLTELINNHFSQTGRINRNHEIIAELPIRTYWTTNYDKLIEQALIQAGKKPDVKKRVNDLAVIKSKRDAIIYKMHGDVEVADEAVLIKNDYELYEKNNQMFTIALKGDLVSKTFLFIGFSFEDPNLEHILSRIKILLDDHTRTHYYFIKEVAEEDYPNNAEGKEQFQYDKIRQELKCADLERYSIKPLIVKKYEDITAILETITERYNRNNLLISGSAHEFNDYKVSGINAEDFIHKLSKTLNQKEFKVATGFGLGVGSAVINGVLEGMEESGTRNINEHLIMRPFPQYATNGKEIGQLWEEYRQQLISECGIVIFMFGNKLTKKEESDEDIVVEANGVIREFDIAVDKNAKVIPIGVTGYASRKLWEQVINDFQRYYPEFPYLKDKFIKLGEDGIEFNQLIKIVTDIVIEIRGGE
ncbi:USG protein [Halalkalibacter wakoensis JCM 9140]|uniref:USG protein n=1 Tax=Halalkalibacter wakoensis JCM 9140 TaxID=1236970 RepID=W4Q6A0_9BACI|nr:SIR2 family protein [Halalkalibacter wakoensis]GAE27470.1 USG protein [Halalkalibacter wakoensis JCM 9140]